MNKAELTQAIEAKTGLNKDDIDKVIKTFTEVVADELAKDGKVQLIGFGTFEVRKRKAKTARNPQTGEAVKVKATKVPVFKAGAGLKEKAAKCKAKDIK